MIEHPSPSEIDLFLDGGLPRERARAVLLHLLRGCEPCRAAMGPKVESLFQLNLDAQGLASIAPEDLARLGLALERMTPQRPARLPRGKRPARGAGVLARLAGVRQEAAGSVSPRAGAHALCEALLARSWTQFQEDPRKMVEYAWYASRAALCLHEEGFPPEEVAALQARALGELANAYRLAERLGEAEKTLAEAEALAGCTAGAAGAGGGAGDPFVAPRLLEIRAGLLGSRHQYREALDLLDRLLAGYETGEDRHAAGRILIQMGLCLGYLGRSPEDTEEALRRLEDGLSRVDPEVDPPLRLTAIHGRLRLLVAGGRLEEALVQLVQHREELQRPERRLDRARLASIEGRIQAGLGQLHLAEGALREARDAFEELDSKADWAVACLDLAAVLAACQGAAGGAGGSGGSGGAGGSGSEARALAEEALWVFRHLRIGDGVLEALGILDQVLQAEILTPGFLRHLAAFVRRAEHDPAARFVPSFA